MESSPKRIWESPWGFVENSLIVWGLVLIGLMLNYLIGNFDFYLLTRPYNLFLGGGIIILILLLGFFNKSPISSWLSSLKLSISLIIALTVLSIVMGLTPQESFVGVQEASHSTLLWRFGFYDMISSWSFVMIYFLILINLGLITFKRLLSKKRKKISFTLNHLGLWLIMFFAGIAYSDLERYIMYVDKGEIEWRVFSDDKEVIELPIAIQLNEFILEEYIPKLAIINKHSGEIHSSIKNSYLQIDTNGRRSKLGEYEIVVDKYIHKSVPETDTSFRYSPMLGANPSALVSISKDNKLITRGWVSYDNIGHLTRSISIDSSLALVMTPADPKSFISEVEVYTQNEKYKKASIEVNKPLRIGSWHIYQYGYDDRMGKLSNYSSFELVYDPWLYFIYTGIALLFIGSILLVVFGKKSI